jgi:serine/threonine protein kinase
MAKCISCAADLADDVRFCSACGAPARHAGNSDDAPTISLPDAEPTAVSPLPPKTPSGSAWRNPSGSSSSRISAPAEFLISEGRFLPGRLIAGRYRIIALLGKGGMGEVYRADDLTLGQGVALKFLPDAAAKDEGLLERFRNEVRIARRVSHPNVCRVYDVGDVDGQTFFTMEYVDGEDLASLLRRIGRLPSDKAVEIARQLCAGLAAAHAKGVLHRDLKPANIMLDGRGQVVITDFGLAGVADNIRGNEIRSGTPAYMSPEQLAGKEVSTKSDIYALGLVLYEVFTGKRAFGDKTGPRQHSDDRTPSRPSSVVKDLDPIVEKIILRCLEAEPAARPANALAVAAALPGGDPLAAALAAGETPSPQMVAAAGETEGLRPRVAITILAAILLGLAFAVGYSMHYNAYEKMGLELTPEVLVQKSRDIIAQLGYAGRPADSEFDIDLDSDLQNAIEKNDKPRPDWNAVLAGRPTLLHLWYRQSPDTLVAEEFHDNLLTPGIAGEQDPPPTVSGMINVEVDMQGRLIYFQAIPPQKLAPAAVSPAPAAYDWNTLFNAAGLDMSKFQPATPAWNSLAASDVRTAWTGVWPGSTRPLRVEAAAFQGKPVFFSLIGDWTKPDRMISSEKKSLGERISGIVSLLLLLGGLTGAALLARRNYRHGRGDRKGAFRLATVMFLLEMGLFACRAHFPSFGESIFLSIMAASTGLFVALAIWLLYMAVEPWVRRQWPTTIISWSRLLAGSWRDPVVGRDILIGVALGVVWVLVFQIRYIPILHMGGAPGSGSTDVLVGGRIALGIWLRQWPQSIQSTLLFFLLLLGLRALLRNIWIAAVVFVAIFVVMSGGLTSTYWRVEVPALALVYSIAVLIVIRFGLVPLAVAIFTINVMANVPFSADLSTWYMPTSIAVLLSVVAIAAWGFYHSLGGQPLWKAEAE